MVTLVSRSPACTGSLTVLPVLAMPLVMAWRIHQVAYVENLNPLRQSNFSTACMRPRLPSCTRSSRGSSAAWYFLAMDTTSRRLALTNVSAASSPSRTSRRSSRLRDGVSVLPAGNLDSSLAARFDGLREPCLVVFGEQGVLTDVVQVEADQVLLRLSGVVVGHSSSSFPMYPDRFIWLQVLTGRVVTPRTRQELDTS